MKFIYNMGEYAIPVKQEEAEEEEGTYPLHRGIILMLIISNREWKMEDPSTISRGGAIAAAPAAAQIVHTEAGLSIGVCLGAVCLSLSHVLLFLFSSQLHLPIPLPTSHIPSPL